MIVNAWVEVRDDFDRESPSNAALLERCGDPDVIPNLYRKPTQGPRTWELYSLQFVVDERREMEQILERFESENPGQAKVLGAWDYFTGEQINDNGVPLYPLTPGRLSDYMPDNDPTVRDVNLYAGQAPRDFG